jgi:SAM-dependent methyltransferase
VEVREEDSRGSAREPRVDAWLADVVARHTRELRSAEFLKAVRALSVRYVERRADLPIRAAADTAGKRAAFAGFFAPLHFVIAQRVLQRLDAGGVDVHDILDLGCGTGVTSAAWALALRQHVVIRGVDRQAWAIDEARWNWQRLGLEGRGRGADLVAAAEQLAARPNRHAVDRTGIVLGWSANELEAAARQRLRDALVALARAGSAILVLEPLARRATPWWAGWVDAFAVCGGRAAEWKLPMDLPEPLARVDAAAGFRRDDLSARSLWVPSRRS